jgi:hypothetical protein
MPMVFRLDLATPRLKTLDVGPWKRGCLLKDLERERADSGGSMGVCGWSPPLAGVPMEPLLWFCTSTCVRRLARLL